MLQHGVRSEPFRRSDQGTLDAPAQTAMRESTEHDVAGTGLLVAGFGILLSASLSVAGLGLDWFGIWAIAGIALMGGGSLDSQVSLADCFRSSCSAEPAYAKEVTRTLLHWPFPRHPTRTRVGARVASPGPGEEPERIAAPNRRLSSWDVTSGLPDDTREEAIRRPSVSAPSSGSQGTSSGVRYVCRSEIQIRMASACRLLSPSSRSPKCRSLKAGCRLPGHKRDNGK